ncbi:tRNA (guanosine(37)-N1)-methyltransferase TrmD [Candidatus Daviesbacteria bacterium]|nr:tRNA (guanosine(37)-N1)-methyltransferase TrmD [Candidatus Daviesbacteria bacterium]
MKIIFLTLFPEIFPAFLNFSILKRAQEKGLIEFEVVNLRDFGLGVHKNVDDRPYGGGAGMVLKADVLSSAVSKIKTRNTRIVLTSASGTPYIQKTARILSGDKDLIIICGHYEGIDERFIEKYVDMEISIGDYVLTGGELPALVIADSITRLLPGVLKKPEASENESFSDPSLLTPHSSLLLEYPHYTRPEEFEGINVPEVLLSGNHKEIELWRKQKSLEKTKKIRPDLLGLKRV